MRKNSQTPNAVVNVDIYHFLVHLTYKLHAITVYLSHGIPPGGWAWFAICLSCVGSLHANLFVSKHASFWCFIHWFFCLDTTPHGHAHL